MSKITCRPTEDEILRLLLSGMADLVYACDTDGNIIFVNKTLEKFTKHKAEVFYRRPFSSLFDASDLEKVMDTYTKTLRGENSECELSFKNTRIVCEYRNFPLRDTRGNIMGVVGIARDITARKQEEERLRVLNEFLETRAREHAGRLIEVNEELMEEMKDRKYRERAFKRSIEKLQKSLQGVIHGMTLIAESREPYGAGHQRRVARLACCIAEEMGFSEDRVEGVNLAAAIHDIGKTSIPAEVLCKTDQLTETELEIVKNHPRAGYNILKGVEFPWPVAQMVLQHHERINGSGYPFGLSEKDIILEAKILGVADVVEAISFPRIHRASSRVDKALDEISQNSGILYDSSVVRACMAVFYKRGFRFECYSDAGLSEDVLLKV